MNQELSLEIKDYAKSLTEAGFAIYPCYGNTTKVEGKRKAAMMKGGSEFYKTGVPYEVFLKDYYRDGVWIGVRCGAVSGNLECLDFDNKFGDAVSIYEQFSAIPDVRQIIDTYGLFVEKTVGGGIHLCYRTHHELDKVIQGGKLARRLDEAKNEVIALIETRTEGQYFVTAPSDGYEIIQGSLFDMQEISLEERNFLIEMALSMDEYFDQSKLYAPPAPRRGSSTATTKSSLRPGAHFDESPEGVEEMVKMLEAEGWSNAYKNRWRRPGKTDGGISATLGYVAPNVFYVFSSNAAPFEPQKCYTPFSMMTLLHFGGDFSKCAAHLAEKGYGQSYDEFRKQLPKEAHVKQARKEAYEIVKRIDKGKGFSEKDVSFLASQHGIEEEEARGVLEEVIKQNDWLIGFDFLHKLEKPRVYIHANYLVRKNKFTNVLTINSRKHPEKAVNEHDLYLELNIKKIPVKKDDLKSILSASDIQEYNPFLEYLESLPKWKEGDQDYIKHYASYFITKDKSMQPFWEEMFKKHIVRSIYCSVGGLENRYIMVLLGDQEDGKSTFIKKLCPDENYYTQRDITEHNSKDVQIALYENIIWQCEEIDALNPQKLGRLKAIVSTGYDKTRDVYGHKAEYRQRVANLWASGNNDEILTDETGNSRFLVFRGKIASHDYNNHLTGTVKVPLDLLWAQAYYLFNRGREFYNPELTPEEKLTRDNVNINYEVSNDVEGHLAELFEPAVGLTTFWSSAKIVRYLNRKKINANGKQINYAVEKLIKKGVWKDVSIENKSGVKWYSISVKKSADSDFAIFVPEPPAEEDLPF